MPENRHTGGAADPDVEALCKAATDADAAELLRVLICHRVTPIVTDIVRRRMRDARDRQEHDDLVHEAILQLLVKLRRMRTLPHEAPIADLASYAAVVADRACSAHLRRKMPQRSRLKNRVRYAVTRDPALGVSEQGRGDWLCGLSSWPQPWTTSGLQRLQELRVGGRAAAGFAIGRDDPARLPLPTLIERLLRFAGGPVDLDDLVSAAATMLALTDQPPVTRGSDRDDSADWPRAVADPARPIVDRLGDAAFLAALWRELRELPINQRTVLLLNLRDGDGHDLTSLLPLVGVAGLGEIAACLDMAVEELRSLWHQLPLDDFAIAARLSLKRQQVINLRKSARERLARRLRSWT
jgi:DNA-directed RNA polymerase specialized sigma24 family protein